jgi:hypothetical protein
MSVVFCQVRGFCDGPIPRVEEAYRLRYRKNEAALAFVGLLDP